MVRQATEVLSLRTVPLPETRQRRTQHTSPLLSIKARNSKRDAPRTLPNFPQVSSAVSALTLSSHFQSFHLGQSFRSYTAAMLATSHGDNQLDSAGLPGIHAARGAKKLPFRPRDLGSKQNIRRYCHSDTRDAQGVELGGK